MKDGEMDRTDGITKFAEEIWKEIDNIPIAMESCTEKDISEKAIIIIDAALKKQRKACANAVGKYLVGWAITHTAFPLDGTIETILAAEVL